MVAHRSLCLGGTIHGDDVDTTKDQLHDLSHAHVQYITHEKMVHSGYSGLREFYLKLKQRFEGTFVQIDERASAKPNVAINEPIWPSATKEKTHVL